MQSVRILFQEPWLDVMFLLCLRIGRELLQCWECGGVGGVIVHRSSGHHDMVTTIDAVSSFPAMQRGVVCGNSLEITFVYLDPREIHMSRPGSYPTKWALVNSRMRLSAFRSLFVITSLLTFLRVKNSLNLFAPLKLFPPIVISPF